MSRRWAYLFAVVLAVTSLACGDGGSPTSPSSPQILAAVIEPFPKPGTWPDGGWNIWIKPYDYSCEGWAKNTGSGCARRVAWTTTIYEQIGRCLFEDGRG